MRIGAMCFGRLASQDSDKICEMNKIIVAFFSVLLLVACEENQGSSGAETPHGASQMHESTAPALSLDNGQKWKADDATNENVSAMLAIVQKSDSEENKEPDNYKTLGDDLQAALDKMIKECKMKGPDHEALHHWLEPLIESVAGLRKSTAVGEAKKIAYDIDTRLKLYSQYFE